MKTQIALVIMALFTSTLMSAQPSKRLDGQRMQQIEAQKVAYITTQLDLTPEESEAFWPIYNEYSEKMEAIRKNRMQMMSGQVSIDQLSEEEAKELMEKRFADREKELKLEREYHAKFLSVLPPQKVAKLYKAEHDFKRELLRKLKKGDRLDHPMKPEEHAPRPR